jgi:hypothetical protein
MPEAASLDARLQNGEMVESGNLPHMPFAAGAEPEAVPTWKRRTYDVGEYTHGKQKYASERRGFACGRHSARAATR